MKLKSLSPIFVSMIVCITTELRCFENSSIVSFMPESEAKNSIQPLLTDHGISLFTTVSMYRKTLHKKLVGLMEGATPLPTVVIALALEYCRAWKKYAEIPTLKGTFAHPRAVFIRYNDRDCLIAQDSFNYKDCYWEDEEDSSTSDFDPSDDDELVVPEGTSVSLNVWDLESKKLCAQIPGVVEGIVELQVSPDGKKLLLCGQDGIIHLYDAQKLARIATLPFKLADDVLCSPQLKESYFGISEDSQWVATAGDGCINIWDIVQNKRIAAMEIPQHFPVDTIAVQCLSPNKCMIVAQEKDKNYLWDIAKKEVSSWHISSHKFRKIQFLDDGTLLSPFGGRLRMYKIGFDSNGLKKVSKTNFCLPKEGELITTFAMAQDKALIAMEGHNNILIKDFPRGDTISVFPIGKEHNHTLAFSVDGNNLAATNNDGIVHVFQNSYDINEGSKC